MLGDEQPDEVVAPPANQHADLRAPEQRPVVLQHALRAEHQRSLAGSLDEGLDGRDQKGFRPPETQDGQPRFTQFVPSEPWNFAPAAPSET